MGGLGVEDRWGCLDVWRFDGGREVRVSNVFLL